MHTLTGAKTESQGLQNLDLLISKLNVPKTTWVAAEMFAYVCMCIGGGEEKDRHRERGQKRRTHKEENKVMESVALMVDTKLESMEH